MKTDISIYKAPSYWQRRMETRSDFFNDEILVKVETDRIIFTHPTIDYQGKTYTPYKNKYGYSLSLICEIPIGNYMFDKEESNEDQKVIYYEN